MDIAESRRVLEEIRSELAHLANEEETSNSTSSVIGDRILAKFMNEHKTLDLTEVSDEFSPENWPAKHESSSST